MAFIRLRISNAHFYAKSRELTHYCLPPYENIIVNDFYIPFYCFCYFILPSHSKLLQRPFHLLHSNNLYNFTTFFYGKTYTSSTWGRIKKINSIPTSSLLVAICGHVHMVCVWQTLDEFCCLIKEKTRMYFRLLWAIVFCNWRVS